MKKQIKKILGVLTVFLLGLFLIGCTVDQEGEVEDTGTRYRN